MNVFLNNLTRNKTNTDLLASYCTFKNIKDSILLTRYRKLEETIGIRLNFTDSEIISNGRMESEELAQKVLHKLLINTCLN